MQEELQQFTQDKVLNSKTLQAESARKMSKKELFDNLRKELEYTLYSTSDICLFFTCSNSKIQDGMMRSNC